MPTTPDIRPLTALKNIGFSLAAKLDRIGIRNESDLRRHGAVETIRRLLRQYPGRRMSIWMDLFSLEGALMNVPWRRVPRERMRFLLKSLAN